LLSEQNAPVLMVEFTDENARNANTNCRNLYSALNLLGYEIFEYIVDENILKPHFVKDYYPYQNLLAIKNLQRVQERLTS
jgi:hypothetical protein